MTWAGDFIQGRGALVALALTLGSADARASASGVAPEAVAALDRFAAAVARTRTFTFRLVKTERLREGKVRESEHLVKLAKPGRVYMRTMKPREGQEVIYDPRRDPRQLVVHRARFPDITVELDIDGELATRNQHHPITHLAFDYALGVLRRAGARAQREPAGERLEYERSCDARGTCRERIVMHAGTRAPESVMARAGEKLLAFAARVDMDPYYILCANPEIEGMHSRLAAKAYVVPSYYGSRAEVVLDAATSLPLEQTIWDDEGRVYERYVFRDLVADAPLTNADFDPDNPAYDF